MADLSIGVDFGTSNTVVAIAESGQPARTLSVRSRAASERAMPSILCFKPDDLDPRAAPVSSAGADAIEDYLQRAGPARLMQSLKSFLGSSSFVDTNLFGHTYTLEQLIARLLGHVYDAAQCRDRLPGARVVVGRPIHFAGSTPDDTLAARRLTDAFTQAGRVPDDVRLEPEAAAYTFARAHPGEHLVLVVDLGGGTSDFSLVAAKNTADHFELKPLAQTGIGIAGDRFDYALVQRVVCPQLGMGTAFRPEHKSLPVPQWLYANFASWHQLAHMNNRQTLRLIGEILRTADDPTAIEGLLHVVRNDEGFSLFQAVSQVKQTLSRTETARLRFKAGPVEIDRVVTRAEFESWIVGELVQIEATAVRALKTAGINPHEITRVFMTGGSSLVPAIRSMFARKFGAEKLVWGDEFASVAQGLAVMGAR
ncbi:MAG: Hsp70 family protein [Steroidobacteraceae bacterium]